MKIIETGMRRYYVIRRKKDGAYLENLLLDANNGQGFWTDHIGRAKAFDEIKEKALPPCKIEVVKIEATYEVIQPNKADIERMKTLDEQRRAAEQRLNKVLEG